MSLKRHEQPPPEYLDELSHRIIHRIEHGEGRQNLWERLTTGFALRPTVAYAFGLTVCGALGLSTVYFVRQEINETADAANGMVFNIPAPAMAAIASQERQEQATLHVSNWMGNTDPASDSQPELSLFHPTRAATPVSYRPDN